MKQRFVCDWCDMSYDTPEECVEHEAECYDNPATHSCETCAHHDTELAGTGKIWNTCAVGLLTSPRWVENHASLCPKWEKVKWF